METAFFVGNHSDSPFLREGGKGRTFVTKGREEYLVTVVIGIQGK